MDFFFFLVLWAGVLICLDHQGFRPCTDQRQINGFIAQVVPFLQHHPDVYAYAYSNGLGLGNVWPLMKGKSLRYVVFWYPMVSVVDWV